MRLKFFFGLFVFSMLWQFAASFERGLGMGLFQGFRMYERPGRFICRSEFAGTGRDQSILSVHPSDEISTGESRHDFVKFKIYGWDWAETLGHEICEKRTDFVKLQITLTCRTDYGFGDPESRELQCPSR